jgi:hypothetical protein
LERPVRCAILRAKPRSKPACGTVPLWRRSSSP